MRTKLSTQLPAYKPSEKVWQNIEKELEGLSKKQNHAPYRYVWSLVASFIFICFVTLQIQYKTNTTSHSKSDTQLVYAEEVLDTLATQSIIIPATNNIDTEIQNLCELQPVKCEDEYAKSLLKQIQDLSNASLELEQSTAGQSIPDTDIQKQKAHIEKEKHKRIKKLKRYLNE